MNSIAFLKINGFEIVNEEYIISDGIIYLSSTVSVWLKIFLKTFDTMYILWYNVIKGNTKWSNSHKYI